MGNKVSCPVVSAPCGKVQGRVSNVPEVSDAKQTYAYLGIPFAKPPVGDLRFEPPQKNIPWEGIFEATSHPPCPIQDTDFSKSIKKYVEFVCQYNGDVLVNTNEDCLYLNVFTSNINEDAKMPVMVWFYGGGFQEGGADCYDPQVICSLHDVVVVIPNYRLNAFGFLSLGSDSKYKGNMGFKDQILALEWVRDNVRQFGGNPENVTIFGESAGSIAVSCHMLSPASRGLFHKTILHSGTIELPVLAPTDPKVAKKMFLDDLGIIETDNDEIMKKLKTLSTKEILAAQINLSKIMQSFRIVVDGEILTDEPHILIQNKAYATVPSIIGYNNTGGGVSLLFDLPNYLEGFSENAVKLMLKGGLAGMFKEDKLELAVKTIMDFYSSDIDDEIKLKWSEMYSRFIGASWFVLPTIHQAKVHSEISCGKTYLYQMTQQLQYNHAEGFGKALFKPAFYKCDHGDDLVFTFGYPFYNGATTLNAKYTEDEKCLSRKWMTYLTNFATHGNPNEGKTVDIEWPNYDQETKKNLQVQFPPLSVGEDLRKDELELWNVTLPGL